MEMIQIKGYPPEKMSAISKQGWHTSHNLLKKTKVSQIIKVNKRGASTEQIHKPGSTPHTSMN